MLLRKSYEQVSRRSQVVGDIITYDSQSDTISYTARCTISRLSRQHEFSLLSPCARVRKSTVHASWASIPNNLVRALPDSPPPSTPIPLFHTSSSQGKCRCCLLSQSVLSTTMLRSPHIAFPTNYHSRHLLLQQIGQRPSCQRK